MCVFKHRIHFSSPVLLVVNCSPQFIGVERAPEYTHLPQEEGHEEREGGAGGRGGDKTGSKRKWKGVFCMVGEEQREEESEQGRGEEQVEEQVPAGWPSKGVVRVEGLTVRYRPTLDPVLQDVSFRLRGGEKCGVVGRTGEHCSSCQLAIDGGVWCDCHLPGNGVVVVIHVALQ
ncbi:unnamed protein product [Closterium sp. NIES-53]